MRLLCFSLTYALTLLFSFVHGSKIDILTRLYSPSVAKLPTPAPPLPEGIFSLVSQVFGSSASAYDDLDDYVPYRSDVFDEFSWRLIKQLLLTPSPDNAMLSPFSIKLVLQLLTEAARNGTATQQQLASAHGDVQMQQNVRSFYKKTLSSLTRHNPQYTLNLATKMYVDASIEPKPSYKELLQQYYDSDVERLQFSEVTKAAHSINEWCKNATNGQLERVVSESSIAQSVLLLINVIYFKGLWRRQFQQSFEGIFLATPHRQLQVDYMQQTDFFYYYRCNDTDTQILRLPYKGKRFSMFVLLPNKENVDVLLRRLQNGQLKRMQFLMEKTEIQVTMPKFKLTFNANVKQALIQLGITDVFTTRASLPELEGKSGAYKNKLKVSNIFQKSGIDVNEMGTEAYATTVVEIINKFGGSNEIPEFNVNRPFLFFIEEESTENILFAGKITNPMG